MEDPALTAAQENILLRPSGTNRSGCQAAGGWWTPRAWRRFRGWCGSPAAALRALRRLLKPGGTITVIEGEARLEKGSAAPKVIVNGKDGKDGKDTRKSHQHQPKAKPAQTQEQQPELQSESESEPEEPELSRPLQVRGPQQHQTAAQSRVR